MGKRSSLTDHAEGNMTYWCVQISLYGFGALIGFRRYRYRENYELRSYEFMSDWWVYYHKFVGQRGEKQRRRCYEAAQRMNDKLACSKNTFQ